MNSVISGADEQCDKWADEQCDKWADEVCDRMADEMADKMADEMADEMMDEMMDEIMRETAHEKLDEELLGQDETVRKDPEDNRVEGEMCGDEPIASEAARDQEIVNDT
jgi:ribosomal protein L16 Arg81 hydroxylase